jgi:hypothetical protein
MLGPKKYLFEIPIYRLSPDEYLKQREDFINKNNNVPKIIAEKEFGGDWRYNEIIGYIRIIYIPPDDGRIIGELWWINAKRIVKTRRKIFKYAYGSKGEFEIRQFEIRKATSNELIFKLLLDNVNNLKTGSFKKYHIDDSLFQLLGKFIDWNGLISS